MLELGVQLIEQIGRTGRGKVLTAPMDVKLTEFDILQPDVLVVSSEHAERLEGRYVDGPPDLVVEVLSPSTATRDLGLKRSAYERSGVREYWIVDTVRRRVAWWTRSESGSLEPHGEFTEELPSHAFPGAVIRLDPLWSR